MLDTFLHTVWRQRAGVGASNEQRNTHDDSERMVLQQAVYLPSGFTGRSWRVACPWWYTDEGREQRSVGDVIKPGRLLQNLASRLGG